jgi:hypothetical protein
MAGYYLYTLDEPKFERFVNEPTTDERMALARLVSDGLDSVDGQLAPDDPIRGWPSEPEALCDIVADRLKRPDWYGDLSNPGKRLWEGAFLSFVMNDKRGKKAVGYRVDFEPVYWDVIDLARRHHGLSGDADPTHVLSRFGMGGYRYHPPRLDRPINMFEDWRPMHSVHPAEEVGALLDALRQAAPTILLPPGEDMPAGLEEALRDQFADGLRQLLDRLKGRKARKRDEYHAQTVSDYTERLLPALETTARKGRMFLVLVDT